MKLTFFLIKKVYNLIGWQTEDMYQNFVPSHFISSVKINQKIDNEYFYLIYK